MAAAGVAALRRYPGLAATLYAVQLLISVVAAWVMASALAVAFSMRPIFASAVDGDALAGAVVLRANPPVAATLLFVALGAAIVYAAVSWFLAGGLIATLLERPVGRQKVAERFGAGGAATFSAYARLWLWCLIPYTAALLVAGVGAAFAWGELERALTVGDAAGALAPTLLPALALTWVTATAAGYARIELSRHPGRSPLAALIRALRTLAANWRAPVHALLYCILWLAITLLYLAITGDRPMLGAAGALWLLLLRQAAVTLRFAAKLALVGGQVELGRTLR
jgi:hypothetical protein